MYFDLTKEIKLDDENYKLYMILRAALYASAAIIAIFLAYKILFPKAFFSFYFNDIAGNKNTILDPQNSTSQAPLSKGDLPANNTLKFSTPLAGTFSKALVNFTLDKNSNELDAGSVKIKKSYAAFLYPTGSQIGFKDGTLIKSDGNFYLVSNGELRQFATPSIFSALGFSQNAFVRVAKEELRYNQIGQKISDIGEYPDDSLFKIADDYYIMQNKTLRRFSSEAAYLSQYDITQAIEKNSGFLDRYDIDENSISFADGSLISYGGGIFITGGNLLFPIDSPATFTQKGFDWNDALPAGADEISLYKKTRTFTILSPHPDGTIFATENEKYYLIKNNEKHLLPSKNIANSWLKRHPVSVSEKSLDIFSDCSLQLDALSMRSYSCEILIENLQSLSGADYEFSAKMNGPIKLDSISVTFKKSLNAKSFRETISGLLNKVKNNYAR